MSQVTITQLTIDLLRCYLTGEPVNFSLTETQCAEVCVLAAKHDIAHLIGEVLPQPSASFVQEKRKAIYRYVRQDYERQRIHALFEAEGIPFIPLKGSVLCALYAEAWHRTGCDIDILVRESDLERAEAALREQLDFSFHKKSAHDISLFSSTGVHLELHYAFDEQEVSVDEVWDSAQPLADGAMQQTMNAEYFVFHHIAHMAKHFREGGCGLRPFVDLWLINRDMDYDRGKLRALLESCGLGRFAEVLYQLSDWWFAGAAPTPLLESTASYILPAGAYGSVENHVAIGRLQQKSKANYFRSRLFLSRTALEYPYPKLKEHGWMLPFYQVHRWYKLLADGKWNHITRELNANRVMSQDYRDHVGTLLKELQLIH